MGNFLKFFRLALVVGPTIIWNYFSWIRPCSSHPEKYPIEYRYKKARKLLFKLIKHFHIDYQVKGVELLNDGRRKIVIANHQGVMETLSLILLSEKPISFVAKKENYKLPFAGRFIRAIDGYFIDRDDPMQALREFRKLVKNMEANDMSYCIFPEGTRNRDPMNIDLLPFHPGSLKLAYLAKVPLLPMAHFGSWRPLGSSNWGSFLEHFTFLPFFEYETFKGVETPAFANVLAEKISASVQVQRLIDERYLEDRKHHKKAPKWWANAEWKSILPSK